MFSICLILVKLVFSSSQLGCLLSPLSCGFCNIWHPASITITTHNQNTHCNTNTHEKKKKWMRCNSNSSHLLLAENMLILCFACAAAASCVNGAARHRLNIQHLPQFLKNIFEIFSWNFIVFRLNKIYLRYILELLGWIKS